MLQDLKSCVEMEEGKKGRKEEEDVKEYLTPFNLGNIVYS